MFSSPKVCGTVDGPCNLPDTLEVRNAYKRTVVGGRRRGTLHGSGQKSELGIGAMLAEMDCLHLFQDRALWFSPGTNGKWPSESVTEFYDQIKHERDNLKKLIINKFSYWEKNIMCSSSLRSIRMFENRHVHLRFSKGNSCCYCTPCTLTL
jgi:hypothetical protein